MHVAVSATRGLCRQGKRWCWPCPLLLHGEPPARWIQSSARTASYGPAGEGNLKYDDDAHQTSTSANVSGEPSVAREQQQQQKQEPLTAGNSARSSGRRGDGGCDTVMLTRDFIARSLYNQDTGYFSTRDVINHLPGPLDFGSMLGEWHYRTAVKKAYDSKLSAWMTPVEVFSPHFSHALARFISQEDAKAARSIKADKAQEKKERRLGRRGGSLNDIQREGAWQPGEGREGLVLYEVGGGTGTNALHVLNWLRQEKPEFYERTEYTIVEISKRLAERQRERVCTVHKNCRVVNADVLEWGLSGDVDPRPCFFLGMEVLDNLPHDKIAWTTPSSRGKLRQRLEETTNASAQPQGEELCEAVVVKTPHGGYVEDFRPLRDPVIRELLKLRPELASMIIPRSSLSSYSGHDSSSWRTSFDSDGNNNGCADGAGTGNVQVGRESGGKDSALQRGKTGSSAIVKHLSGLFGTSDPCPEYRAAFVPTGLLKLVKVLSKKLPRHRAIFADFDSFPNVATAASGREVEDMGGTSDMDALMAFQAPIVSSRDPATGNVTDHDTYMVPLGSADIFFPTCFKSLAGLHADVCGGLNLEKEDGQAMGGEVTRRRGKAFKQGAFLKMYGDVESTRTLTGYNPMLEDYRNASVFLSGEIIDIYH